MFNLSFLPFLKIVDKTYLAMHSGLKKGWIGFLILFIGLGLFLTVKSEFSLQIYHTCSHKSGYKLVCTYKWLLFSLSMTKTL